jgi:hypothetical protein
VFAANVAAAADVAASLAAAGLQPLLYHREVPAAERAAALDTMRSQCVAMTASCSCSQSDSAVFCCYLQDGTALQSVVS